jgi:hypothetical protein
MLTYSLMSTCTVHVLVEMQIYKEEISLKQYQNFQGIRTVLKQGFLRMTRLLYHTNLDRGRSVKYTLTVADFGLSSLFIFSLVQVED